MIIDELIFDRTERDLEEAKEYIYRNEPFPDNNLRFSWDYRAFNRTEKAMKYLQDKYELIGYYAELEVKTDWYIDEITREQEERYLRNLGKIKALMIIPISATNLPTTINGMTIERANNIEKILFEANNVANMLKDNMVRSGVGNLGQARFWQQRFRRHQKIETNKWEELEITNWDETTSKTWEEVSIK